MKRNLNGSSDFIRVLVKDRDPFLWSDSSPEQLYRTGYGISEFREREW